MSLFAVEEVTSDAAHPRGLNHTCHQFVPHAQDESGITLTCVEVWGVTSVALLTPATIRWPTLSATDRPKLLSCLASDNQDRTAVIRAAGLLRGHRGA